MKPEINNETVEIVLTPQILHNSKGCKHYFIQKTSGTIECAHCKLGLFGSAQDGKLC